MKKFIPVLLVAIFAACSPSRMITPCPQDVTKAIDPIKGATGEFTIDTVAEWMHISIRMPGFVVARKALAVRADGMCYRHLQCDGRPFPKHYIVGWCEGRNALFNQSLIQLK